VTEIEPVGSRRLARHALLQERPEWRDAGARPDHDDRLIGIGRQREVLRLLHIDPDLVAGRNAACEKCRSNTKTRALVHLIANGIDCERDTARIAFERRRNRIDARLQSIERLDEGFRVRPDAGKFLQRRQHVERAGIAVGILPVGQRR
jgi:hypothetical protein